jgi:puromycin-sensitive aminopeptidase
VVLPAGGHPANVVSVTQHRSYRLSRATHPERYDLEFHIDPSQPTFTGVARIAIVVDETTDTIDLNAVGLEISSARIADESLGVALDEEHELVALSLPRALEAGAKTEIELAFTGGYREDLIGAYRSFYKAPDGTEQVLVATQFEATGARRAFPCYDEPDRKAVFTVTLEVPTGLAAVSNGEELAREPSSTPGFELVRFAPTMVMSTYLVAFVVGNLVASPTVRSRGVPIRVLTVPGKESLTSYALEVASFAIEFFEDFFAIEFPTTKLDLIGIPDFAFGAMENLGAVTFRETALLVDAERGGERERKRVAEVVCHEIAHMWFGDLVTMKWWNGIWLNEAFATYMEQSAIDAFNPSWRAWDAFGVARLEAMAVDSLPTTRPIEYPVEAPKDADSMFDVLTYEKGGSVLKMLEQYFGLETFRQAVRNYLVRHRHGNAETTDLWQALAELRSEPVTEMMDSWIFQGGHPLVLAEQLPGGLRITQEPFRLLSQEGDPIGEIGSHWIVPIVARDLGSGEESRTLLAHESEVLTTSGGLTVLNAGGIGVYRTAYVGSLMAQLVDRLEDLALLERLNLLADSWSLVVADRLGLEEIVGLLRRLASERDPNVLEYAASVIDILWRIALPDERPLVSALAREVFWPALEDLGMEPREDDTPQARIARSVAFGVLGTIADDSEVRAQATQWFREEMSGVGGPSGDMADAVLAIVASHGDDAEFAFMLDRYRNPTDPQDERRHLFALADFPQPSLVNRVLQMTLGQIRTHDAAGVLRRAMVNPAQGQLALDFLFAHFDELIARLPANTYDWLFEGLPRLIDEDAARRAPEVLAFVAGHPVPVGERTVAQILDRYKAHLRLRERLAGRLVSYLERG